MGGWVGGVTYLVLQDLNKLRLRDAVAVKHDAVGEGFGGLVEFEEEFLDHVLQVLEMGGWVGGLVR